MDAFKQIIFNASTQIRRSSKRPDAECVPKILTSNSATNITLQDLQDKMQFLLSTWKIENRQTKQGPDTFFVTADWSDIES